MDLVMKKDNQWSINKNLLLSNLKNLEPGANKRIFAIDFIIQNLASNLRFMIDFIICCRSSVPMSYSLPVILREDGSEIMIDFTIDMFVNYYESHHNNLSSWQRFIFKILKHYSSDKYFNKSLDRIIPEINMSYKQLEKLMLLPEEEFEKLIVDDQKLGWSLYDLIFNINWDWNLKLMFNLDVDQYELVDSNIQKLEYYYEPNLAASKKFKTIDNIPGSFTLNEKLVADIMGGIPKDFDDLEKAYYIYYRLCEKFYYDEDYYCYAFGTVSKSMKPKPIIDHTDITRLNTLYGDSGVVCSEITMLYVEFLKLLNIPYQLCGYFENQIVRYGVSHMRVRFKIGEYIIDADAANGIFNSDMSTVKIFGETYGFTPIIDLPWRIKDDCKRKMKRVEAYIAEHSKDNEFNDALEIYEQLFAKKFEIPLAQKVNVLRSIIKNIKAPYIITFAWVEELVERIFGRDNSNCHAEFMIKYDLNNTNRPYELILVIIFNEVGSIDKDYIHNSYYIISKDQPEEALDYYEFKRRTDLKIYDFTTENRKKRYNFGEKFDVQKRKR